MPGPVPTYVPPDDGAWDSADPNFKAKVRGCGKCGRQFVTSARWRYFCDRCRNLAGAVHREVQPVRFGNHYGLSGGRSPDD